MYSFRKFQAAQYHYNNVLNFLRNFKNKKGVNIKAELLKNYHEPKGYTIRSTTTTEISSNHYVYELSACLEAILSAIDFLASACKVHLKGIKLDSVTSLIRLVRKGKCGPILNKVKKHLIWLENIRSYRHHLVHRILFTLSSVRKSQHIGDIESNVILPVVVPRMPPKYFPDTRRSRIIKDFPGLKIPYIETTITIDNTIIDYELEYPTTDDYISIEEFMKENLNSFKKYFADVIKELTTLNFHEIKLI